MLPAKAFCRFWATSRSLTPTSSRPGSIDVDLQGRRVEGLLNARVGDSRDAGDLGQQLVGIGAVGLDLRADDLHVDRRGQAEVENLGHNVGGQEGEGRARKLARQLFAHRLHVSRRLGLPTVVQGDEDIGIRGADGSGIGVGHVDAADRQADVVDDRVQRLGRDDRPDGRLDLVDLRPRFPRSAFRSGRARAGRSACSRLAERSCGRGKGRARTRQRTRSHEAGDEQTAARPARSSRRRR